jgi:tRNA-dihydrouridine synthase A
MPIIAIAPMIRYTDKHYRFLMRVITQHTLLYTEMIPTGYLVWGKQHHLLQLSETEHPTALQLGGAEPEQLALCSKMGEDYGYDEINLNVGCPSACVQAGNFGACLMKEPLRVADCIAAMKNAVRVPVTIKTRIGVDDHDSYDALHRFVTLTSQAGCNTFIIHARKAWLKGLSPRENRDIPPLRYEVVYRLKRDFPKLTIIINGGIKTMEQIEQHLLEVDGVMLGREAYSNPYFFADIDARFFGVKQDVIERKNILMQYVPYIAEQIKAGAPIQHLTRHLFGLLHGQPGAKQWRKMLSEDLLKQENKFEFLEKVVQQAL